MMTMINRIITTNIPGKQNSTSFNSILFPKVFKTQLCNNPVHLKECQITAGIHTRLSIRFVAGVWPVAIEAAILKSFVGQYHQVVGDSDSRVARFCWKPCLHLFKKAIFYEALLLLILFRSTPTPPTPPPQFPFPWPVLSLSCLLTNTVMNKTIYVSYSYMYRRIVI